MSPAWDGDLGHDRDRVELGTADRIEGVAQQVRVSRRDHEHGSGNDQLFQVSAQRQGDGQDHASRDREGELQHHKRAQVVAELLPVAGRLAGVERVEAEIGDDRDEGQVRKEGRVAAITGVAESGCQHDDHDQGDHPRDRPGAEHENGVADRARTELWCGDDGLFAHGGIVDVRSQRDFWLPGSVLVVMGRAFKWFGALAVVAALGTGAVFYLTHRSSTPIAYVTPTTVPLNPSADGTATTAPSAEALPPTVLMPVPYTTQAPFGNWEARQHTCEEASLVMVDHYLRGDHSGAPIDPAIADAAINQITPWKPAVDLTTQQVGEVAKLHLGWSYEVFQASRLNMQRQLALGRPLIVGVRTHGLGNANYPGYSTHYEQPAWSVSHYLVVVGYRASGSFVLNDPGITRGQGYDITYDQLMHAIDDLDQAYPALNSGRVFLVLAPSAGA